MKQLTLTLTLMLCLCVTMIGCEATDDGLKAAVAQPLSCEDGSLTAGRAATELADAYCQGRSCSASEYADWLLAGRDPADVLDAEYTYNFDPTSCRRDALNACVSGLGDPKAELPERCLWLVRTSPAWLTPKGPGDHGDPIAGYDENLAQDTAPVLVGAFVSDVDERMNCGWDRCGDSGGYVCQSDSGDLCLWQRGTWHFQCGSGCVQGGSSCYRCSALGSWS